MFRILIICTANVCRSPAAQEFLRRALQGYQVKVDSAGTLAVNGNLADSTIQSLMLDRGFPELSTHRSQVLLPSLLPEYELILCMERSHIDHVRRTSVLSVGKTMLLGHWDGEQEVNDPIGQSREIYMGSLDEMEQFSNQWAQKIIDMGMVA